MQFTTNPHEHTTNATSPHWLAPLAVLVAWLVSLLNQIANLKRIRATTRFKPHWTDTWDDLRRLEWHRDQMLAQGAALLLAGKSLNDAEAQLTDPPDDYGGPRPRTPFQTQRRFLAIAEWLKDPEAMIRRHAARIAKRAGIDLTRDPLRHGAARRATSPTCAASGGGNTPAPLASLSRHATGGGGMRAPCAHDGGGLSANRARAPPITATTLAALLAQRPARLRSPPHALANCPSPHHSPSHALGGCNR